MVRSTSVAILSILLMTGPSLACGVQGSAKRTDGSKVDGSATISSSWNSTKAYPLGGFYTLELGSSACGEKVTLYVDGRQFAVVKLPKSGNSRADLLLKGSTNNPVR